MLAEFAFTPEVFDEASQPDITVWREQLRDLGSAMFPRVSASPVIVSDLYGGSWGHAADRCAHLITDPTARYLCQNLLKRAMDVLVKRPAAGPWPEDEAGWAREALQSHGIEPIERIVASSACREKLRPECPALRSLDETTESGFWSGISSDASPAKRIDEQVGLVRKLCVLSDFIALISPHIYGADDDETDFALRFLNTTLNRPIGFASADVELHVRDDETCASPPTESADPTGLMGAVIKRVRAALRPGQQVTVVAWPKFVERLVIAGVHTTRNGNPHVRSPRWGIAMSHIARRGDAHRSDEPTEWKLLKQESLGRWFDRYCAPGVNGCVRRVVRR